jgi:hypothetical protein
MFRRSLMLRPKLSHIACDGWHLAGELIRITVSLIRMKTVPFAEKVAEFSQLGYGEARASLQLG